MFNSNFTLTEETPVNTHLDFHSRTRPSTTLILTASPCSLRNAPLRRSRRVLPRSVQRRAGDPAGQGDILWTYSEAGWDTPTPAPSRRLPQASLAGPGRQIQRHYRPMATGNQLEGYDLAKITTKWNTEPGSRSPRGGSYGDYRGVGGVDGRLYRVWVVSRYATI